MLMLKMHIREGGNPIATFIEAKNAGKDVMDTYIDTVGRMRGVLMCLPRSEVAALVW